MKTKILGLLAVGLLAGPVAANSTVIYEFTGQSGLGQLTFVYESAGFLTTETFVDQASLTSCTTGAGFSCAGVYLLRPTFSGFEGDLLELVSSTPGVVVTNGYFFSEGVFGAFGTYAELSNLAVLTVRDGTKVPEPGTLALLGLGFSRRRKAD